MNIRRILREERRLSPFINRRLPEDEINEYFNKVKNRLMTMIISDNSSMMDKDEFKQFIITYTINFIMENYYDTFPEMTDFYEKLFDELYEYYNNEMDESYESINNMNLQEQISRIRSMMDISDMNILDKPLQICGKNPMTGYFRDGYCKTDSSDEGTHTVCSEVDDEFLEFTKSKGNDLSFLKSGDRWCLCANRWKEAYDEGVAPKVIKNATNKKTLDVIGDDIKDEELTEYARTLKNARRQGAGLRFPKSAIKANPLRFRPYNR
jgi:uncharacterized protein (DUF2237 family)